MKGENQSIFERDILVLLGFHDLDNIVEAGRVSCAVQRIHIHGDWNPQTVSYDADIAVLILEREVGFNEHIQPICMIKSNSKITSLTYGRVVGNGKSGGAEDYERIPKVLKIPIQTDKQCIIKDSYFMFQLSGRTFCGGSANGSGNCSGDSGSGFIVSYASAYYLRGIVSSSLVTEFGCDVYSFSVFTDALKFFDWIQSI